MGAIKGSVEEIARSGQQLVNFSQDLSQELASIKNTVDQIGELTFGSASDKLLDVYYSLNEDLQKYVVELDTLGTNVQASASNLETIDTEASANLSYEG
ncbi:MAG: WXG100 family type VII secretion target [Pseudobutyrivibrio sp.]|nr:WXG100 family type VII secretion target [Pseudobutyrivibrio sp.]